MFQNKFFIQHFLASNTENIYWIRLIWFTIQHLISNTISNVDFNVFNYSNVYSSVFIKTARGDCIHSVLSFAVRASWAVVKKKQAL